MPSAPWTLEKFTILVTAERHVRPSAPDGRVVLRGQSASTRLFPPDFLQFSIGAMAPPGGGHHMHGGSPGDSAAGPRWTAVPMPPGLTMLPAEMALRPEAIPYLPSGDAPAVRPRAQVRLTTGDTLRLEAGLVRRTLGGRDYTMYAFNGQQPGPLIEVARGAEITVAFTNHLSRPTTMHWHGIRLDNRSDGVPGLTQRDVPPGGEFIYRLHFPDAGIYWYHPHVREDTQQELGLYGNLLVRSTDGGDYGPANREAVLMLDDLLIGEDGLVPLGQDTPTHALMGRFGNQLLVNGEPDYRLAVRRGEVVRFFLTNAANARTMNVSFPGARMKVVASDVGPFEHEQWVESVVIAPAERYVVHVRFDRPGRVALVNRVRGLDHLYGRFFAEADTLGLVTVADRRVDRDLARSFAATRRNVAVSAEIERYRRLAGQRATQDTGAGARDAGSATVHPAADAARLDLLSASRVERDHADDELGLHWPAGRLDPARPRNRPGEHGYRLAAPPGAAGPYPAGESARERSRDAAPDPLSRPALPGAGGERRAE